MNGEVGNIFPCSGICSVSRIHHPGHSADVGNETAVQVSASESFTSPARSAGEAVAPGRIAEIVGATLKWFYEILYRYFRAPWEMGARDELVSLVESGRIKPGRAIDLGCGTGTNAIFLAQHGFEVTGVDFSKAAIEKAHALASAAGVQVAFVEDDLTDLRHISGTFDLLLDYGVLDDLRLHQREPYLSSMLPLTHPGSYYLLWGHEYPMRWWEKFVPFFDIPFYPGEIEQRFGQYFEIETLWSRIDYSKWPPGHAAYLMTRMGVTSNVLK